MGQAQLLIWIQTRQLITLKIICVAKKDPQILMVLHDDQMTLLSSLSSTALNANQYISAIKWAAELHGALLQPKMPIYTTPG